MSFWCEDYIDSHRAPYWICSLIGCVCADEGPYCLRCGAELYGDADFVEGGIWWRVVCWWQREIVSRLRLRRCVVCSKVTGRGQDAPICCDGCFEDWVPF